MVVRVSRAGLVMSTPFVIVNTGKSRTERSYDRLSPLNDISGVMVSLYVFVIRLNPIALSNFQRSMVCSRFKDTWELMVSGSRYCRSTSIRPFVELALSGVMLVRVPGRVTDR